MNYHVAKKCENMKIPIKYDKKFNKIIKIVTILTGVFSLVYIILLMLPQEATDALNSAIIPIILLGNGSIPVFLLCLALLISSSLYLARLKKNTFEVPESRRDYDNDLAKLPRKQVVENRYASDSQKAFYLSIIMYGFAIIFDIVYFVRWRKYVSDSMVLFFMLIFGHLLFIIVGGFIKKQEDTEKYADDVDVRSDKKPRMNIVEASWILIVMGLVAAFTILTANTMTDYIYKSRNSSYDETIDDFKAKATLEISSTNLKDGKWDLEITNTSSDNGENNLSPQISFSRVQGAEYYVIYMVDETANNWVHWLATDIRETELRAGANKDKYAEDESFKYIGPYPPVGSGDHTYTVYVYAMKGKPDLDMELEFDQSFLGPDDFYYDYLNIAEQGDINTYGNVIEYGYISGVFGR
ncbi:MAG: hypothetical protein K6E10_00545 [Eubacterium sp.]|nr:hypothetical protein [Eubacterium sp.]